MEKRAPFIVFEGIDGSGKSTQISLLQEKIQKQGNPCFVTREPSDGPVGSLIRQFLSGRMQADERTLAALFAADRLDHLTNHTDGVIAKLEQGIAVISDRYYLSNYAYNGVRASLEWVMQLNTVSADLLKPDCHIFVDVSPEKALERIGKGRFHTELYETKERLTEVRDKFFDIFEQVESSENVFIVDGDRSMEEISQEIWNGVAKYF